MKAYTTLAALVLVCGFGATGLWAAQANPGPYAATIPEFSLKDPADKEHTQKDLEKKCVAIIITIPNVKHGDHQGRWKRYLTQKAWPKDKWKLVMLEDLAQSEHREKALPKMKESYKEGQDTLLLLDHTSDVRKKFLVPQDETVVLLYNSKGELVHSTGEKPTIDEARDIRKLMEKVE